MLIGIVLASAIQLLTGYFTETNRRPVQDIAQSSETGAATVILSGVAYGMESAVYAALLIAGGGLRRVPARARGTPPSPCSRWRWPAAAC